jgi:hypothetical protein
MSRNKKRKNLSHGTNMQQISNNYYSKPETNTDNNIKEHSFYITLLNNVQEYCEKVLSSQRMYQLQQITQQQDYFETQLAQQKANWEDFLAKFSVIQSTSQ